MNEERTIRFKHMFDDGGPFVVETPGSRGIEPSRIAIAARLCDAPNCPCRDMMLAVRRLESLGDGRARIVESSEVRAKFYWCMKPGCPCKEFQIEVLRADGGNIGMVEAETSKWQGKKSKSESVALSLWQTQEEAKGRNLWPASVGMSALLPAAAKSI